MKEEYEEIKVSLGQLKYAKIIQKLLCERLDMELPNEYELSEIVVEQALFSYIDLMERYYRLEGTEWEEFYQKYHGIKNIPRKLEHFKEQKKGSLQILSKSKKRTATTKSKHL